LSFPSRFTRAPFFFSFLFNDPPTTEIYTLSLHDALPISMPLAAQQPRADLATARSGVILDAYSFGSGFAFDNVVEWTVPVTVSQHVGQRLTVDLSAAFARASGATTSGNFRVSGFTDTDVRASWATGSGHLILAVAATLPTG